MAIRELFGYQKATGLTDFSCRIRFAPPLVIEESDLQNAIKIIEQSLQDLDEVRVPFFCAVRNISSQFQLEFIPGEDPSPDRVPSMDK